MVYEKRSEYTNSRIKTFIKSMFTVMSNNNIGWDFERSVDLTRDKTQTGTKENKSVVDTHVGV